MGAKVLLFYEMCTVYALYSEVVTGWSSTEELNCAQFWQGFVNGMNQAAQQIRRQQQIQRQREQQQERIRQQQEAAQRRQEEAQRRLL